MKFAGNCSGIEIPRLGLFADRGVMLENKCIAVNRLQGRSNNEIGQRPRVPKIKELPSVSMRLIIAVVSL